MYRFLSDFFRTGINRFIQKKSLIQHQTSEHIQCGRRDLNPHVVANTRSLVQPVCQFQHFRITNKNYYSVLICVCQHFFSKKQINIFKIQKFKLPTPQYLTRSHIAYYVDGLIIFCSRYILSPAIKKRKINMVTRMQNGSQNEKKHNLNRFSCYNRSIEGQFTCLHDITSTQCSSQEFLRNSGMRRNHAQLL